MTTLPTPNIKTIKEFLLCPACGNGDSRTIETRMSKGNIVRRRRACKSCDHRWSTYEITGEMMRQYLELKTIAMQASRADVAMAKMAQMPITPNGRMRPR